jgi:hypothetical protein
MSKISFVFSPISEILADAVSSSNMIGDSINCFPVFDFIVSATFLKMTGCLEQKIQAIRWELATNNLEYRRDILSNGINDCSSYKDKNEIFKQTARELRSLSLTEEYIVNQKDYLSTIKQELITIFKNSSLKNIMPRSYMEFEEIIDELIKDSENYNLFNPKGINITLFGEKKASILNKNKFLFIFENYIYRRRNQIAHNTKSNLQNLPLIKIMNDENFKYDNYFVFFAVLMLIDKTFIDMFQVYKKNIM